MEWRSADDPSLIISMEYSERYKINSVSGSYSRPRCALLQGSGKERRDQDDSRFSLVSNRRSRL